ILQISREMGIGAQFGGKHFCLDTRVIIFSGCQKIFRYYSVFCSTTYNAVPYFGTSLYEWYKRIYLPNQYEICQGVLKYMAMIPGTGLSSKRWANWVENGKKTNHNDRNFVWDLARRSLGGFGFLVIGYCL
ncbi:hypothetical protein ACFL2S_14180, partial [Thermodesulfobacteriota bacterium]